MSFWYLLKFSFQIQFIYAPDMDAILILIQIFSQIQFRYAPDTDDILILIQSQLFRYNSDTLQTRMPLWYSFRISSQDTVQIRSRRGCHSIAHSNSTFRYNTNTLQTRMPFCYSFRFQNSDTVRIRSRHGCHSDTHSDFKFRYSTDTLQTRMPFWYSFRFNFQIQYVYAPNTDAILILIQISSSDTIWICSRHGFHSDTHSDFKFRYSTSTLQTRMPFWYSFRFQVQI